MRWFNHITITTSTAYLITPDLNPAYLGIIGFGCIFPDWIETLGTKKRQIPHRTITHSILLWLLIIPFLSYLFLKTNNHSAFELWKWFSFGIIGHLVEDSITKTGIPIFIGRKRIAFRWLTTGSHGEYIISWIFLLLVFIKDKIINFI